MIEFVLVSLNRFSFFHSPFIEKNNLVIKMMRFLQREIIIDFFLNGKRLLISLTCHLNLQVKLLAVIGLKIWRRMREKIGKFATV